MGKKTFRFSHLMATDAGVTIFRTRDARNIVGNIEFNNGNQGQLILGAMLRKGTGLKRFNYQNVIGKYNIVAVVRVLESFERETPLFGGSKAPEDSDFIELACIKPRGGENKSLFSLQGRC